MKSLIAAAMLTMVAATAHADCIVADPSPTPLNVRTSPYGQVIGTLDNGQSVAIIDHTVDNRGRDWVYVSDPETERPIGWVFREYVVCKGDMRPNSARRAENCDGLSYQRNSIFKRAGYCFKTAEQIRNFGNSGCQFDDQSSVPLSQHDRAEIAAIVEREREMGCR